VRLAIRVGDLDKAARFYETVFGFKTVPGAAVANTRRLTDGAFDIVLMKGEGASSAKHHHIGVKVFDAGAFRDRLARNGASLQPDSGSTFFHAPDGTLTEIVTPMG
jgi:catechol 2,3-dioxygenase-like lactoylglutathione lyase family enzyme